MIVLHNEDENEEELVISKLEDSNKNLQRSDLKKIKF